MIFCLILWIGAVGVLPAAGQAARPTDPSQDEIQGVIDVLKDPAERDKLIRRLEILANAKTDASTEKEAPTATAQLLETISTRMESATGAMTQFVDVVEEVPQGLAWADRQVRLPENRAFWLQTLFNIAVVVLLGYVIFHLSRGLFRRPRKQLSDAGADASVWSKALRLVVRFLLDLMPAALFILAVYAMLGFLDPQEKIRFVVLAWTHAFVLNRLVFLAARFVFAPRSPRLRLIRLSDEIAGRLQKWTQRFSGLIIYGYAALQAALLLGLETALYESLLRLYGLLVVAMAVAFVLRHRKPVADALRGVGRDRESGKRRFAGNTLDQATRIWHIAAILYLFIVYGVWAFYMAGSAFFLLKGTVLTLLAAAIGAALLRGLHPLFHRKVQVSHEMKAHFSRLDQRSHRYMGIIYKILRLVIVASVILTVIQIWGVDVLGWLSGETGRLLLETLLRVAGVLILALIVWEIATAYIEKYLQEKTEDGVTQSYSARTRTLMSVIRKALLIALVVVTTLTVLSELGVDIAPLLAGAGVLGLAIGFGAQKLVQDVITGVFILLEDQISEGDVVSVGGKAGLVESVDIRTIRLRDLSGTVHTLPYSAIDSVSNLTKEFSFYIFDVGVAYREDVDYVMAVLQEIGDELKADPEYGPVILEPLEMLGVDAFADSAVVIKARIKTVPIKQWWVGREFNRRMKKRFDDLAIEIPFPHQTLYFGVDKDQNAPPARVRLIARGDRAVAEEAEELAGRAPERIDPGMTDEPEAD